MILFAEPQNAVCARIAKCEINKNGHHDSALSNRLRSIIESIPKGALHRRGGRWRPSLSYEISMGHELCALDNDVVRSNLQCAFNISKPIKEVIMLR